MTSVAGDEGEDRGPSGGEAAADASIGRVLAHRYVLRRLLGEGGFGMVFEAEDRRLEKRVAVKLLTGAVAKKPDALGRFKQEAIAAARIGHKGIVDVTDFDEDADGTHFIVMELIEGVDLAQVMAEQPMTVARAMAIAARVGQTLAHAHERGIIHRDLKPANIMLTALGGVEDFVKVLDFGISKVVSVNEDVSVTATGHVVGTPRYMAPEQGLGNKEIDGRVDVYALGGILYEMITGVPPYEGTSQYELIHNKLTYAPRPPSVVAAQEIPLAVDRLVLKALAREPSERWASMAEFEAAIREELEKISPQTAALVRPATPIPRAPSLGGGKPRSVSRTPSAKVASVATRVLTPPRKQRESAAGPDTEPGAVAAGPDAAAEISPTAAAEQRATMSWKVMVLIGLAVVGATTWVLVRPRVGGEPTPPVAAPTPPEPVPVASAPPMPPPEIVRNTPLTPPPATVEVDLVLDPPTARVELDGAVTTADPIRLPKDGASHTLVVSAPGKKPETRTITGEAGAIVKIKLEPEKKQARPTGGRLPDSPL